MSRIGAWFIVLFIALLVMLAFPDDANSALAHGLCLSPMYQPRV